MSGALLRIEKASQAIAECKTVDEAKEIRDKAKAVAVYLRQTKAAFSAQQDAAEIGLKAERKMGEMLAATVEHGGSKFREGTLKKLDVTKKESFRAQQLAAVPDAEFAAKIAKARADQERLTTGAVLSDARRRERTRKLVEISRADAPLSAVGRRFPILYADPPWRYEHSATENRAIENQYPTMALEEICGLEVPTVATDDAVLFLWAPCPS